uniref:Uncharacterized protein n=1 Tax=Rhizophora mucronata TaxID=61149 RepID=A0A2P2PFJ6_RHIMU
MIQLEMSASPTVLLSIYVYIERLDCPTPISSTLSGTLPHRTN